MGAVSSLFEDPTVTCMGDDPSDRSVQYLFECTPERVFSELWLFLRRGSKSDGENPGGSI
jgi:hypothetical protein